MASSSYMFGKPSIEPSSQGAHSCLQAPKWYLLQSPTCGPVWRLLVQHQLPSPEAVGDNWPSQVICCSMARIAIIVPSQACLPIASHPCLLGSLQPSPLPTQPTSIASLPGAGKQQKCHTGMTVLNHPNSAGSHPGHSATVSTVGCVSPGGLL